MKNPLIRMREMLREVGNAERQLAEKILHDPQIVMDSNVRELAAKTYVSPSTVSRLSKHIGFSGYDEFRKAVIYELALYESSTHINQKDVRINDDIATIASKITTRNIRALEESLSILDTDVLSHCIQLIGESDNVFLFGMGESHLVARDIFLKFLRVDKICMIENDWHSQLVLSRNAKPSDVAIMISYSGETQEMVRCMENLKANKTHTILITRYSSSTLASMAESVLYISASEMLPRGSASASRLSQLNLVDILFSAYVNANYEACSHKLDKTYIKKTDE